MSFKYINPGYSKLCDVNNASTDSTGNYNSENEVAIVNGKAVINIADKNFTEIWIKFDFTFKSKSTGHIIRISQDGTTSGNYSDFWQQNGSLISCGAGDTTYYQHSYNFATKSTFLMHIKSDASNGIYEIIDSGTTIFTFTGNVMNGGTIGNIYLDVDAVGEYAYSNIIISDTEISQNEKIAIIPMKTISTDWTDNGDGSYSVSETGKTLLETLDIDKLLSNIEQTNATIKAVSINAINTSYTSPVNALTSEVISGSTTQEVTTKALSGSGWYTPAMEINPINASDWTLADLRNIQLGIKSAGV